MTWWPIEFMRWGAVAALIVATAYMAPQARMWFRARINERAWFNIAAMAVCLSDAIQRAYGGINHIINYPAHYPMDATGISVGTNAYAFVGGCLMMRYAVMNVHGRQWWLGYMAGVLAFGALMAP